MMKFKVEIGYGDDYWDMGQDEYICNSIEECERHIMEDHGECEFDFERNGVRWYNDMMATIEEIED